MSLKMIGTLCIITSSLAFADGSINESKRHLVDEMLVIINAAETIDMFANAFVDQTIEAMRTVNKDLPDRALEISREETIRAFRERMEDGSYNEMMYPIYDSHFTVEDLEAIIAFYHSDAGRKYSASFITMSQDTMVAAQKWAIPIAEAANRRIAQKLEEEGISLSE